MTKLDNPTGMKEEVSYGKSTQSGEWNIPKIRIMSDGTLRGTKVFWGDKEIGDTISHIDISIDSQEVNKAVITFNNVDINIEVDKDKVEKN